MKMKKETNASNTVVMPTRSHLVDIFKLISHPVPHIILSINIPYKCFCVLSLNNSTASTLHVFDSDIKCAGS